MRQRHLLDSSHKRPKALRTSLLVLAATIAVSSADPLAAAGFTALPAASAPGAKKSPLLHKVAVFGKDERVPVPQSYRPAAERIGVIRDPASHSVCTVLCVAPDIVATAAHCLYGTNASEPLDLTGLTVRLHGGREKSRIAGAEQGTPEAGVLAGSTRLKIRPPIDATHDWGLVKLAKPLCQGKALALSRRPVREVMRMAQAGRVYQIAYHRDLPQWRPMLGRPCRVQHDFKDADWKTIGKDFADPSQLLLHTCDTGAASSGSPLLVDGPNGPEVVGINVGTYVQSKLIMLNGEVVHRFKSDEVANTGVNSLAFASALDAFSRADLITTTSDVRRLQERLAAHRLFEGRADGHFSAQTRAAIALYERASGLPETGLPTRPLLHALSGESTLATGAIEERPHSVRVRARHGR